MTRADESQLGSQPPAKGRRLQKSLVLFAIGLMAQALIVGLALRSTAQHPRQADVQIVDVQTYAGAVTDTIEVTLGNAGPDSAHVSSWLVAYSAIPYLTILSCETDLGTTMHGAGLEVEGCSGDHGNVPAGVTVTHRAVVLARTGSYDWDFGVSSDVPDEDLDNNYGFDHMVVDPRNVGIGDGTPRVGIGIVSFPLTRTHGVSVPAIVTFTSNVTLSTEVIGSVVMEPPGVFSCTNFLPTSGGVDQWDLEGEKGFYWWTGEISPGELAALGVSCHISDTGTVLLKAGLLSVLPPPFQDHPDDANAAMAVLGLRGDSSMPEIATQGRVYSSTLRVQSVDDEPITNLAITATLIASPQNSSAYEDVAVDTDDPDTVVECEIIAPALARCLVESLASHASFTATYPVIPNAPGHNIQRIIMAQNDQMLYNLGQAITVEDVDEVPELVVTKRALDQFATPGLPITYSMTVTNSGNAAAINVLMTDTLPAFTLPNMEESADGWECWEDNERATCTYLIPGLFERGTFTLTLVADVAPRVPAHLIAFTNTAFVAADNSGPVPAVGQVVTPIAPKPDLEIFKVATVDAVAPGGHITWSLEVANRGEGLANGVVVTETLPVYTSPASSIDWECGQGGPGAICTYRGPDLGAGEVFTTAFAAVVLPDLPPEVTVITNTATVTEESRRDPTPGNSTSTASTPVEPDEEILCDANGDGAVSILDIFIMVGLGIRNQPATACPVCDLDGDGVITVLDMRQCVLRCDNPGCMP